MTAPVAVDVLAVLDRQIADLIELQNYSSPQDNGHLADEIEQGPLRFWREARAAVAELIEAAAKVLALPEARKELEYLRKGIGTATPAKAWLELQQSLARCVGAQ